MQLLILVPVGGGLELAAPEIGRSRFREWTLSPLSVILNTPNQYFMRRILFLHNHTSQKLRP
jgi:hypothetical protein